MAKVSIPVHKDDENTSQKTHLIHNPLSNADIHSGSNTGRFFDTFSHSLVFQSNPKVALPKGRNLRVTRVLKARLLAVWWGAPTVKLVTVTKKNI